MIFRTLEKKYGQKPVIRHFGTSKERDRFLTAQRMTRKWEHLMPINETDEKYVSSWRSGAEIVDMRPKPFTGRSTRDND